MRKPQRILAAVLVTALLLTGCAAPAMHTYGTQQAQSAEKAQGTSPAAGEEQTAAAQSDVSAAGEEQSVAPAESTPSPTPLPTPTPFPTLTPTPSPIPEPTKIEPDPSAFEDPDSLLVVANKKHPLPYDYEPYDLVVPNVRATKTAYLREEAAYALEEMFDAAEADGVYLYLGSGYRSAYTQDGLYQSYVDMYGTEVADSLSSRPGYSDHQTGLAVDIADAGEVTFLTFAFGETEEGYWLKDHAHEYGWIMRYPYDKEDITGYRYEPWHFRYVGVDTATAIWEVDEFYSFEEYFDISGGDYED